jgi:hypothetical protein
MDLNWRIRPARRLRAGFRKFFKKKKCIARAARPRPFHSLPSPDPNGGRCPLSFGGIIENQNSDFVTV